MKIRPVIMAWGLIWLMMDGCAGKGEVVLVDIPSQQLAVGAPGVAPRGLRVVVEMFEDSRPTKSRLGARSHLWGGESYFEVPGGSLGDATTQALVRYLNRNGWRAQVVKPGAGSLNADLTISGQLLMLALDAKSRVGSTKLTTASKLTIRALNGADGSTVRMTLDGAGSDSVFWFEREDAQQLVNDVLDDCFKQLIQDTRVEGKVLRLRDHAG